MRSPLSIPREQAHQILVEWNDTDRPYADRCLQVLFEEQTARIFQLLLCGSALQRLSQ